MRELDWDKRYSDSWMALTAKARAKVKNHCCLCFKKTGRLECHHVVYSNKKGAIAGSEMVGVHVFPLCKPCHKIAHNKKNWIYDNTDPVLKNRNTVEFYRTLRKNYQKITKSLKQNKLKSHDHRTHQIQT